MANRTYAIAVEAYTRAEDAARGRRDAAVAAAEADYRQAVASADLMLQRVAIHAFPRAIPATLAETSFVR